VGFVRQAVVGQVAADQEHIHGVGQLGKQGLQLPLGGPGAVQVRHRSNAHHAGGARDA
jgi:hypothetical protein